MFELDENGDELWGFWGAQCQTCDIYGRFNDLMLCEDCAGKLERDLIRQRDWDYTASGFGLPAEKREELRRQVIAQYGAAYELIVPPEKGSKGKKRGRKRRR